MKVDNVLLCLAALLPAAEIAQAQVVRRDPAVTYYTLNEINDPRTLSLGESVVARGADVELWNSNPASIAGTRGHGAAFTHTSDRSGYKMPLTTAGIWGTTSFGVFAFHYARIEYGTFVRTFGNGSGGDTISPYDQTFALSFGTALLKPLEIGVGVKLFQEVMQFPDPGITYPLNAYVDVGARCSFAGFAGEGRMRDTVHVGLSARNFGERYAVGGIGQSEPIAAFLSAGVAYDVAWGGRDRPGFCVSASAEYQRLLNPDSVQGTGLYSYRTFPERIGIGGEFNYDDIVALRIGSDIPFGHLSGGQSLKPSFRYGGGIRMPLARLDIDAPLTVGFDYGVVTYPSYGSGGTATPGATLLNVRLLYQPGSKP